MDVSTDNFRGCPKNSSNSIEEKDRISELTRKEFYNSWQSSVMKHLPDFASITNLVVDPATSIFLSNQEGVIKKRMMNMVKQEMFSDSSKTLKLVFMQM